ncbi:MAG: hypothetical protein AAGL89_00650 [Pseudomonadota bacterium]
MDMWILLAVGGSSFMCGVALMYLVMMRTLKKRIAEGAFTLA